MPAECPTPSRIAAGPRGAYGGNSPQPRRDEELLLEYAVSGDHDVFAELVRRHEHDLYSFLYDRLRDAHLAEDALQNTLLQLHCKCRQFQRGRRLRPWLYTIAGNQAIDLLRRNRRHKAAHLCAASGDMAREEEQPLGSILEGAAMAPEATSIAHEDRERTRLAMHVVPEKLRQVLKLVMYQGLQYQEAAAVLGIPLGTIKSRMHKALQDFRHALVAVRRSSAPDARRLAS